MTARDLRFVGRELFDVAPSEILYERRDHGGSSSAHARIGKRKFVSESRDGEFAPGARRLLVFEHPRIINQDNGRHKRGGPTPACGLALFVDRLMTNWQILR